MTTTGVPKKLIEVALPLAVINKAAAREKSIRHGHPSTLHLWWARRPLAAARAVIFAQMVDDPFEYVDVLLSDPATKRAAQRELKKRLTARASVATAAPVTGNGNIRPGEKPGATDEAELRALTLGDVAAELERARLFGILEETGSVGEHDQRGGAEAGADRDLAELAPGRAPRTPVTRAPRICSIATRCLPFTTRSPAAAPCRSKRSGWASKPMPATSTRWRC